MEERPLSTFDVRVREIHRLLGTVEPPWSLWRWTSAKISMVSSRLRVSTLDETWEVMPEWLEWKGFSGLLVTGRDADGKRRRLRLKFASVGDAWNLAALVPGYQNESQENLNG